MRANHDTIAPEPREAQCKLEPRGGVGRSAGVSWAR